MDTLQPHSSKQPLSPTPTTVEATSTIRLSPLEIPHILDLIFSFLSNHTLLSSVSLVCRDWYLHNKNRFCRTVYFEEGRDEQYMNSFLARLPGAYRLDCVLIFDSTSASKTCHMKDILLQHHQQSQSWSQAQGRLEDRETRMDTNTTTLCKFSPLRELVIRISFRLDDTLRGFPFLPTLTSLELDLQSLATEVVDLDPILKTCPLLEALSVKAAAVTGHWMVWTILDQKKLQEHRPHLALRSLVLKNIGFPQDHLENVLLFTPHLKVLKLLSMDWNSDLKHDWTRLMNHIKALGIALTAVDFSLYDPNNCHFPEPPLPMSSSSCPELAPRMHEICPLTTDWIFHAAKVTPMFLKTLSLRTTFVTSMELYWRNRSNYSTGQCCKNDLKDAPRLVHEYLCTSPQLVHLQTLKAPIRPEYMDLFGRGVGSGGDGYNTATKRQSTVMPSPHPAIWMCRSLKTLDIEIHGKSNPRVLFGYISRVLPHLEQLNIARPAVCESESGALIYATIDLHLRDGLCLLSRLRCLERLCIEPIRNGADMALTCTMMDLSWLLSSSSTSVENDSSSAEFKAQRKEEVERWDMQRGMEEYRESTRPPGSLEMMMPPAGTRQEDREIWHQLRHLGMYLDVEEMVHEMDSDGFKSLPSLYQLSLGSFYPQRPEVELDYVLSGKVL